MLIEMVVLGRFRSYRTVNTACIARTDQMKLFREFLLFAVRTHTYGCAVQTDCQVSGFRRRIHEMFALLGCYIALICRYGRFFLDYLTMEDETETSVTTDRRCVTCKNSERSHIAKFRSVRAGCTYAYYCGLTLWHRNFTFKF